jgi:hypothetical protein
MSKEDLFVDLKVISENVRDVWPDVFGDDPEMGKRSSYRTMD